MKDTPAATTASKALTPRYMRIDSHICMTYTSRHISSHNHADYTGSKQIANIALRQQGTQKHAETPLASTALAHASSCMSYVNLCTKCQTEELGERRLSHLFSKRTLGSMLFSLLHMFQLKAGEGAHNSLRFSSGTSPSHSSTTFLYGPAGSVHSAPTSILICVFRLLMVCTPRQKQGSATTQTSCQNLPQQASDKGQHHWDSTHSVARERDRPTACKVLWF